MHCKHIVLEHVRARLNLGAVISSHKIHKDKERRDNSLPDGKSRSEAYISMLLKHYLGKGLMARRRGGEEDGTTHACNIYWAVALQQSWST